MTLPTDLSSYDYKFNKTLNEDVQLVSDEYGKYDLDFDNGDYINVTGTNSLHNACVIAILTRYNELKRIPHYTGFGCRVHDLIKGNKTKLQRFKLETSINETLTNMRRIKTVNDITIVDEDTDSYFVEFDVTSINDETIRGRVSL